MQLRIYANLIASLSQVPGPQMSHISSAYHDKDMATRGCMSLEKGSENEIYGPLQFVCVQMFFFLDLLILIPSRKLKNAVS